MECVTCQGAGRDEYDVCIECNGSGYSHPTKTVIARRKINNVTVTLREKEDAK